MLHVCPSSSRFRRACYCHCGQARCSRSLWVSGPESPPALTVDRHKYGYLQRLSLSLESLSERPVGCIRARTPLTRAWRPWKSHYPPPRGCRAGAGMLLIVRILLKVAGRVSPGLGAAADSMALSLVQSTVSLLASVKASIIEMKQRLPEPA